MHQEKNTAKHIFNNDGKENLTDLFYTQNLETKKKLVRSPACWTTVTGKKRKKMAIEEQPLILDLYYIASMLQVTKG